MMNVVFWIVAAALCALVALYVAAPLRAQAVGTGETEERAQHRALREHSEMLRRDLRELEADRAEGKLAPTEYQHLYEQTAQQSDTVSAQLATTRIEREAERDRERASQSSAHTGRSRLELEIELEVAIMRARLKPKAAVWACPQCGRKMPEGDKFCASCGTPNPHA